MKTAVGRGVTYEVNGKKLLVELDLAGEGVPSRSGESLVVATTGGNQALVIDGKIAKLSLNLFVPVSKTA